MCLTREPCGAYHVLMTNPNPRNGITYYVNGEFRAYSATDSGNRVRMMRRAMELGATDLVQYRNGRAYPVGA